MHRLLDLMKRMGELIQKMGKPAALLTLTHPWIFKGGRRGP